MNTTPLAYNVTSRSIVVQLEGKPFVIARSNPSYTAVYQAIKEGDWDSIPDLVNPKQAIHKMSNGRVTITDDTVIFDGKPMHSVLAGRIVQQFREGFDVNPMVNFLVNLEANPSRTSREELYLFLEANDIPFTTDGHFLAYKRVREDYTDCHSGTFDNSVGSVCEMARRDVDDNRERTCSAGLHFCSYDYLKSFGGARTMIVKINPRDVVSIPSDYNNAKGRTSRYVVTDEIANDHTESVFGSSVYGSNGRLDSASYAYTEVDHMDFQDYLEDNAEVFSEEYDVLRNWFEGFSSYLDGSEYYDGGSDYWDEVEYDSTQSQFWRYGWLNAWAIDG